MLTIFTCSFFSLILVIFPAASQQQSAGQTGQESQPAPFRCAQPISEQNVIIREAEREHYTTRRVQFIGNTYTRDMVLRRRIIIGLQEGELFTRRNLVRSLRNVSRLKIIYPVSQKDIEMQLNRSEKTVDMIICFKEREKNTAENAPANKALQLTVR
ncbi:MAG: POTRA domain-containing protein [Pyrinomonadaceae bacterium]